MDSSWSFLNDLSKNNTEILFRVSNKCGIDKNISSPKEIAQIIIDRFNASSTCNNYTEFSKIMINLVKVDAFFKSDIEYNIDLLIMASALLGYLLNDDKLLMQFSVNEGMASREKDFFKKEFISRFKISKQFRERIPYYLLAILGVDKSNIDKASSVSLNMFLSGVASYATLFSFLSSPVTASLVARTVLPLFPISIILMLTLGVKKILLTSKELIPVSLVLVFLHYECQIAVKSIEEAMSFCEKLIMQDKDAKAFASYNEALHNINHSFIINNGRISRLFILYYLFSNSFKEPNDRVKELLYQLEIFVKYRIEIFFSTVFLESLIPYASSLIDVLLAGNEKNVLNNNEYYNNDLQYLLVEYIYPFSPIEKNIYVLIDRRERINSIITKLYFEYKGINSDTNCLTYDKIHLKSFDVIIGLNEKNFKRYSHFLKDNTIISKHDDYALQIEPSRDIINKDKTNNLEISLDELEFVKKEIRHNALKYFPRIKKDIRQGNTDRAIEYLERVEKYIKDFAVSNDEPEKINFMTYFRECFSDKDWDIDWNNVPQEIWVYFSVSRLHSCVLSNILNNLQTHAYPNGYAPYGKKIRINVEYGETTVSIFISNNGLPFEGDTDRLFSYAYKYNSNGEGIGMFSLKKAMNKYEGDVRFTCDNISEFPVTYILTFKRI